MIERAADVFCYVAPIAVWGLFIWSAWPVIESFF